MLKYRPSQIAMGRDASWTIIYVDFDGYLALDVFNDHGGVAQFVDVTYVYLPLGRYGHWYLVKLDLEDFSGYVETPLQEYGDCGVMMCKALKRLVMGKTLDGRGLSGRKIADKYKKYMAKTVYKYMDKT
ncbi:hypothetical protein Tco_1236796 [Tanacetum coccineum]